jgi:hypothetical protein
MSNRIDYAKASPAGYKAFGGVYVHLQNSGLEKELVNLVSRSRLADQIGSALLPPRIASATTIILRWMVVSLDIRLASKFGAPNTSLTERARPLRPQ